MGVIETNNDKRREAILQEEAKRDKIVKDVLAECNVTVISGRKTLPLAGWDAEYKVEYHGRRFCIKDVATIPPDKLASYIREQLDKGVAPAC